MNFIIHNGFRLPILGARITDSNTQEKEEYLRLIKKIYPNFIIKGTLAYYGIRENVYSSICAINEETALLLEMEEREKELIKFMEDEFHYGALLEVQSMIIKLKQLLKEEK